MHPVKKKDGVGLYRTDELLQKIQNRIEIFLRCEFIKNYEDYLVSKNGEIYLVKGKIIPYKLKSKIDKYGYETVTLSNRYGKKYIGIHRGLFQSEKGEYINADVNGSYQIMKKVFPKAFANGIVGAGSHPVVVNIPLQTANVI